MLPYCSASWFWWRGKDHQCSHAWDHPWVPDSVSSRWRGDWYANILTYFYTYGKSLVMCVQHQKYTYFNNCVFDFSLTRGASAWNYVLLRLHVSSCQLLRVHDFLPSLCVLGFGGKGSSYSDINRGAIFLIMSVHLNKSNVF